MHFVLIQETILSSFSSTWKNIRQNLSKSGSILITIPSLEESLCIGDGGKVCSDIFFMNFRYSLTMELLL